jgi:hypothetical protein
MTVSIAAYLAQAGHTITRLERDIVNAVTLENFSVVLVELTRLFVQCVLVENSAIRWQLIVNRAQVEHTFREAQITLHMIHQMIALCAQVEHGVGQRRQAAPCVPRESISMTSR